MLLVNTAVDNLANSDSIGSKDSAEPEIIRTVKIVGHHRIQMLRVMQIHQLLHLHWLVFLNSSNSVNGTNDDFLAIMQAINGSCRDVPDSHQTLASVLHLPQHHHWAVLLVPDKRFKNEPSY